MRTFERSTTLKEDTSEFVENEGCLVVSWVSGQ